MMLPAHTSSITSLARRFAFVALVRCRLRGRRRRRVGRQLAGMARSAARRALDRDRTAGEVVAAGAGRRRPARTWPGGSRSAAARRRSSSATASTSTPRPAPRSCGRSGWWRSMRRAARRSGRSISASISPTSRRTAWRGPRRRSIPPPGTSTRSAAMPRCGRFHPTARCSGSVAWSRTSAPSRPTAAGRRRRSSMATSSWSTR